jgi:hypothetical protein
VSEKRAPVGRVPYVIPGSDELPPRFEAIDANVQGCGGSDDDDRGRFAAAWRLLNLAS